MITDKWEFAGYAWCNDVCDRYGKSHQELPGDTCQVLGRTIPALLLKEVSEN